MSAKKTLKTFIVILITFIIIVIFMNQYEKKKLDEFGNKCSQIKPGMTELQVKNILGEPKYKQMIDIKTWEHIPKELSKNSIYLTYDYCFEFIFNLRNKCDLMYRIYFNTNTKKVVHFFHINF